MASVEEYLRNLVQDQLSFYEDKLNRMRKQGGDGLTTELRKLINLPAPKRATGPKWNMWLLGKKLRELTSLPDVAHRLEIIRARLRAGNLIGAHEALCQFEVDRAFVEGHSYKRPLQHGIKNTKKLDAARVEANGPEREKRKRWKLQLAEFEAARARGLRKMEAYRSAAKKCGVKPKTIIRTVEQNRGA